MTTVDRTVPPVNLEVPDEVSVSRPLNYIDGDRRPAAGDAVFPTVSPYDERTWAWLPDSGEADVDAAVAAARRAFDSGPWSRTTAAERSALLYRLADLVEDNADDLAYIETMDNGKLLREVTPQIRALPQWYRFFAGAADKVYGDTLPTDNTDYMIYTRREPIGVVASIVGWNSALLQLTFKLAPALAVGCTLVAKPPEQASVSTLEFAKLVEAAGFPPGVFNAVTGTGEKAGRALVRHPGIDKVAFTGSAATGSLVMKDAADRHTRVSLELGGKSPNIVFDDADLVAAANGVVAGIFAATGQTCVAGSRLLVHESVHDEFVARLVDRARTIKLGDPFAADTEMGPVAYKEQYDNILDFIASGIEDGAGLACGGKAATNVSDAGYFIEPTIFTGVDNTMRIARAEIFGPVLCVLPFRDEEEAVRLANDNDYGLSAGVWTNDIRRGHRIAHALRAGTVWVNGFRAVSVNAPFGGYKSSGIGRENGMAVLDLYTENKSVWIEMTGETRDPFRMYW